MMSDELRWRNRGGVFFGPGGEPTSLSLPPPGPSKFHKALTIFCFATFGVAALLVGGLWLSLVYQVTIAHKPDGTTISSNQLEYVGGQAAFGWGVVSLTFTGMLGVFAILSNFDYPKSFMLGRTRYVSLELLIQCAYIFSLVGLVTTFCWYVASMDNLLPVYQSHAPKIPTFHLAHVTLGLNVFYNTYCAWWLRQIRRAEVSKIADDSKRARRALKAQARAPASGDGQGSGFATRLKW